MSKEIVVSGIRSTGHLHLGNYFGAIQNYVKMQETHDCYFFVADYHSLTTHPDPKDLKQNVFRVVAENIASGLDPEQVALYAQSDVPEIPELYLMLNMTAYVGELEKVPTFKDKVRSQPDNVNAGLLTYPVLMAADILIHRAVKVPVGKDQEQHLEMARNFAQRFNSRYGEFFPEPQVFRSNQDTVKIMSLDGVGKMSKSENVNATIYLSDDDDTIKKKIMKAKTDAGPTEPNAEMPDYIQNLFLLMHLASNPAVTETFRTAYNNCNIRYGDMNRLLLRPLSPLFNTLSSEVAGKVVFLIFDVPIVLGLALILRPELRLTLEAALAFIPALLLAWLLRFFWGYWLALLAFWATRADALLAVQDALVFLLAGAVAPLALLPAALQSLAIVLPFRYMVGFPVEVLTGQVTGANLLTGFALQGAWLAVALTLYAVLWRAGLRHYSAVGG